jgi:protein-S-isoprenylcysteine O-methyltransferase Ste14
MDSAGLRQSSTRPESACSEWIPWIGVAGVVAIITLLPAYGWAPDPSLLTMLVIAAFGGPILFLEALTGRYRSLWTRPARYHLPRTLTKYLGLIATVALWAGIYWLLDDYDNERFGPWWDLLAHWLPWVLAVAPIYLLIVDARDPEPEDGLWALGRLCLGRRNPEDAAKLGNHLRGWLVKGFFLPLMCIWLGEQATWMITRLDRGGGVDFELLHRGLFLLDLAIAATGYVLALKASNSHIRSAEPALMGWVVALACYPPFNVFLADHFLAYDVGPGWRQVFGEQSPTMLTIWATIILGLEAIYVWATIPFGIRFSNLTNRGIITTGPYRFCRHPAYLAKNASWWFISLPFVVDAPWHEGLRLSLLLACWNLIYYLRARTEEQHLRQDPTYVAYCDWIDRHGLWARVRALIQRPR